jgi:hypothetical protein
MMVLSAVGYYSNLSPSREPLAAISKPKIMATTISTLHILQEYLNGVLERADHHANNVNEIALAIAGGIIWKTTKNVKVMSRNGDMKNVLWLEVNSKIICFVYNHSTGNIDVRDGGIQGVTIITFNNSNTIADVKNFFKSL